MKGKDGNTITTEREQADRWVEYFCEVLNHPQPDEPADPHQCQITSTSTPVPPTEAEIRNAIKDMKSGKASGIDSIRAEMLKADLSTATRVLTYLFDTIWDKETIPSDWGKGLIIKIPKKGNLQVCDNWRGITLLSIPSKVFCRILLGRIETSIDKKLRQEQAGFRKRIGCTDQIFALRNIIAQTLEWNCPLYINFIDFKKAFDSIHHDTLWKILRSYGVPLKIVSLIETFYSHFECSVILSNRSSEWFPLKSGVRQGCILSPILFLVVIDWVRRKTTSDKPRGICGLSFPS